jgi:hypothetical protein
MKITEALQLTDKTLFETLDKGNDTGVLTEDLVKVVRTHNNNEWSEAMTLEESLSVDRMIAEGKFPK